MIDSFDMSVENRNVYLKHVASVLRSKYFVNLSGLAKAAGILPQNLNDFVNGKEKFGVKRLNKLELFLIDLYERILEDEVPQIPSEFNIFVETLVENEVVEI